MLAPILMQSSTSWKPPESLSLKETLILVGISLPQHRAPPRTFPNTANLAFNTVLPGKSLEVVPSLATVLYCHQLRI